MRASKSQSARRSNDSYFGPAANRMLVPRRGKVVNTMSSVCTILVGEGERLSSIKKGGLAAARQSKQTIFSWHAPKKYSWGSKRFVFRIWNAPPLGMSRDHGALLIVTVAIVSSAFALFISELWSYARRYAARTCTAAAS